MFRGTPCICRFRKQKVAINSHFNHRFFLYSFSFKFKCYTNCIQTISIILMKNQFVFKFANHSGNIKHKTPFWPLDKQKTTPWENLKFINPPPCICQNSAEYRFISSIYRFISSVYRFISSVYRFISSVYRFISLVKVCFH